MQREREREKREERERGRRGKRRSERRNNDLGEDEGKEQREREEEGRERLTRKEDRKSRKRLLRARRIGEMVMRRTKPRTAQGGREQEHMKSPPMQSHRVIQINVKVGDCKAVVLDVAPGDEMSDIVKRAPSSRCGSKRDVHVSCGGRVLKKECRGEVVRHLRQKHATHQP